MISRPARQSWLDLKVPRSRIKRGLRFCGFFAVSVLLQITARAQGTATSESGTNSSPAPRKLTFNKDVAPIIFQHCAECHHPGEAAPFDLLTYRDVLKHARQIRDVVERRYMPPWLPAKGVGEFANDPSLSDAQIETIRQWVADGTIEGDPKDLPPPPKWTKGWRLGKPDLVVKMPWAYTLSPDGLDVYRNFVFPIPLNERKFVKGVEFLPSNPKVLHHSFIFVDPTPFSRRIAEKENPPGFDGMVMPETARMPGGQFLGWRPGKIPDMAPDGLGWVLEPKSDLVLQMHMHPDGKPEVLQPSVGFFFTDKPPTNMAFRLNLTALQIDIPAGDKAYVVQDHYTLPIDVELIGISPHAHYLCKRMEGSAVLPDGTHQDLLLIKDWDFNWQNDYRYAKPVFLPKGTRLDMRYTYDNSRENIRNPNDPPKRVRYGLQTTDEMAELWFLLLPRNLEARNVLAKDFYGHLAKIALDYNESVIREHPDDAAAQTRAGRALIYFGHIPEALEHFAAAVKADPDYDRAYYEQGYVYLHLNRSEEAQKAFENVIRLNPDDYEAHGSLGVIYLRERKLDQAQSEFEAALRINPQDPIARRNLEIVRKIKGQPTP